MEVPQKVKLKGEENILIFAQTANYLTKFLYNMDNNSSINIPDEDLVISKKKNLRFIVSKKDTRENKWIDVKNDLSLSDALMLCEQEFGEAISISIWLISNNGNFLYWRSNFPNVFNTPLLEL